MTKVWKSYLNSQSPRYQAWRAILDSEEVPIKDPVPCLSRLGELEEDYAHPLDVDALTPEQRARVIDFIVERFGEDHLIVDLDLDREGFAIRAADVMFAYDVYALPIKADLVFDQGIYDHAVKCGAVAVQWVAHTGLAIHPDIKGTIGRPHHRLCPADQRIVPAWLIGASGWNLTVTIEIQSLEMCEYVRMLMLPEGSRLIFTDRITELPEEEVTVEEEDNISLSA